MDRAVLASIQTRTSSFRCSLIFEKLRIVKLTNTSIIMTVTDCHRKPLYQLSSRARWDLELTGWIGFTLSAIAYIVSSARVPDYTALAASVAFLIGDVCFVIALLSTPRPMLSPMLSATVHSDEKQGEEQMSNNLPTGTH